MPSIPFLKEIAQILLQPGAYDLSATCVVFPNKRASLYLSRYIGEFTEKPVWAPRYYTINELMEEISGYTMGDRLTLLFELYKSFRDITRTREGFDVLYPYCETLLTDFDEIDKYQVDAKDLFSNLASLKSIEGRFSYLTEEQVTLIRRFWKTFNPDAFSDAQTAFIKLWDALPAVYHEFKSRLQKQGIAYEGMAYRQSIINLAESDKTSLPAIQKFLIIGFNALNKCEEKLFRILKNRNQADFFWDYDTWYTNNDIHEAGFFIRKNLKDFPQAKPLCNDNLKQEKDQVIFVPVSSNTGQTAVIPNILNRFGMQEPGRIESTALVLADENLLIPALHAIPQEITDINVSIGYPMAGSAVFSLIDALYELIRNARVGDDGSTSWYFSDVLGILCNPLLKHDYSETLEKVRQLVLERHKVYLESSDIVHDPDSIFKYRLSDDAAQYLLDVVTGIIRQLSGIVDEHGLNPVHEELLFQVYTFLTRLKDVLALQDFVPGSAVIFKLVRSMVKHLHVPFTGEPLIGMQVLGILETRTLDFDNLILLSANEGILPKTTTGSSFIPHNLRAGFGMPTAEFQDAMYAYYFYRLIQRARNIALVYDSSSGGLKTGERSRFLHQLIYEMRWPVTELSISSPLAKIPVKDIIIEKNESVKSALSAFTNGGARVLSPSAINEFLNCPLRFYFHHIARLPQPEEVTGEIDARMFGSILHGALQSVYHGFGSDPVTQEKLNHLLKEGATLDTALDKSFSDVLFGQGSDYSERQPEGFNLIVKQILRTYIRQFITAECEACPFTVMDLEKKHELAMDVNESDFSGTVNIGGIIDRIDLYEGRIRILDYKTGSVKNTFPSVGSLFETGNHLRNESVFQVLLYALIYERLHCGENVVPGLLFLRDSYADDFTWTIRFGENKGREVLSDFSMVSDAYEKLLKKTLSGLFNFRVPFYQTSNLKVCRICPYAMICRREGTE